MEGFDCERGSCGFDAVQYFKKLMENSEWNVFTPDLVCLLCRRYEKIKKNKISNILL